MALSIYRYAPVSCHLKNSDGVLPPYDSPAKIFSKESKHNQKMKANYLLILILNPLSFSDKFKDIKKLKALFLKSSKKLWIEIRSDIFYFSFVL